MTRGSALSHGTFVRFGQRCLIVFTGKVGRREFPQTTSEGSSSAERRPAGCIDAFGPAVSPEFFCLHKITYPDLMYEIGHNGIPRSYRDLQGHLGKACTPTRVIEIVDMRPSTKIVMHTGGRTS
jgi:hypothetical protein